MKHIVKGDEPRELFLWKQLVNADWQPTYAQLRGTEKRAVKHALMMEQGFLCCYCERRLVAGDSHIEHFRPQGDPACDDLDYHNLLCSCQNQIKQGEPRHCGNLKDGWFDENRLVSPLMPDCETHFAYAGDGSIRTVYPTDDAARTTIEKLGLDIAKLRALRKQAMDPFLDPDLSDSEVSQFAAGYLSRDDQGRFGEFWTTIRYLFGASAIA